MVVWCPDWPVVAAAAEVWAGRHRPRRRHRVRRGVRLLGGGRAATASGAGCGGATPPPAAPTWCWPTTALSATSGRSRRCWARSSRSAPRSPRSGRACAPWRCRAASTAARPRRPPWWRSTWSPPGCGTAGPGSPTACSPPSRPPSRPPRRRASSSPWAVAPVPVPAPVAVLDDLEKVSLSAGSGCGPWATWPRCRCGTWRPGSAGRAPGCTGWPGGPTPGRPSPGSRPAARRARGLLARPGDHRADRLQHPAYRGGVRRRAVRHGLVCGEVRIEVSGEHGSLRSRVWAHPRWFSAADLVDRLYWQLQGDPAPEPVETVRLIPEGVESLADHGEGLWGTAPDERIVRGVARLQGMLGPEQVLTPSLQGGRSPRERQALTPWGERAGDHRPAGLPWPGSIPPPAPAQVLAEPLAAMVLSAEGLPVRLTGRGAVSAEPVRMRVATPTSVRPVAVRRAGRPTWSWTPGRGHGPSTSSGGTRRPPGRSPVSRSSPSTAPPGCWWSRAASGGSRPAMSEPDLPDLTALDRREWRRPARPYGVSRARRRHSRGAGRRVARATGGG